MNKKKPFDIKAVCEHCHKPTHVTAELPSDPIALAPEVESYMHPTSLKYVYRVTIDDIKRFLLTKARLLVPGIKLEVVGVYCERKTKNKDDHRAHAYVRVAYSSEAVEKNEDLGWYGRLGDRTSNVSIVKDLSKFMIDKYKYDRREIDKCIKDYEYMEILEESFGMTENYLSNLRSFCTPRGLKATDNTLWVIVAANPAKIFEDMLANSDDHTLHGEVKIQDVNMISKDNVEFTVYYDPYAIQAKDDPNVVKLLLGNK